MIPLKFGTERANQKNFPSNSHEWDLHQVFYIEKKAIDDHLGTEAVKNWNQFKEVDKVLAPMKALNNAIAGTYAKRGDIPALYRSTVFGTPLDLKLCGIGQGPVLLLSHLGRGFVAMPSNEPGLIVLTLKRVQRQAQLFHGIKSGKP